MTTTDLMNAESSNSHRLWHLTSMQSLATDRQRRFVMEYLRDFNGAAAAARAGYSAASAKQQASRLLLTNDDLQKALGECRDRLASRLELTAEGVLEELSEAVTEARDAGNHSAAISGIRLMGDHLGLWNGPDDKAKGGPVEEATAVEVDDRDDGQRLRDFAGEVRMLANQRGCLQRTVEDFVDDIDGFCDKAGVPRRIA